MECQLVILAAGNGSRMANDDLPKVMHEVGNKPMIELVLDNAVKVTQDLVLVYSHKLKPYIAKYEHLCALALQEEQLGTAHAVYSALPLLRQDKMIAVIYGDNPLITSEIISSLLDHLIATSSAIVTLAFQRNDPSQYGRIITDESGNFVKIIEHKDADEKERLITLCNSGVMAFAPSILHKYLPLCVDSEAKHENEFYLTKIIELCQPHEKLSYLLSKEDELVIGVNTKQELIDANKIYHKIHSNKI